MKFSLLPLTVKLATINLLLVASLLAVVVVAWRHLPADSDAVGVTQLSRAQRATQNADMLHDALHADVLSALLAAPGDAAERAKVQKSTHDNSNEFRGELAALGAMTWNAEVQPTIAAARLASLTYVQRADAMVHAALASPSAALRERASFETAFEQTKTALAAQTTQIAQQLDEAHAQTRQASDAAKRWLLLAALGTVVGGWLGVALIARSIRLSLTGLRDVAQAVAAGNLERRSDRRGRDEVGQLAGSVNQMADTLHNMIERMRLDAERGTFGAQLVSALDMADREAQAHSVVEFAMERVSATHAMELLLADSSEAHLERAAAHPTAGAPGCGVDSPFSCVAVRRGHAVSFASSDALDTCPKLRGRAGGALAAVCVPVTFMGRALGVLHACGPAAQPLDDAASERLTTLGTQVGSRIGTVRAFERTQLQASTDALTGLPNRRSVEERLRELMRARQPFAFVMADLDHFKQLNDTHGHPAGDEALRAFSDVVRESMRHQDVAGRWGGEEFAFVLASTDCHHALQWVDRLRDRLAQALQRRSAPAFTASFGIADSSAAPSPDALVAIADGALYRAKSDGRNRGVLAQHGAALAASIRSRVAEPGAGVDLQRTVASV